MVSHGGYSLEAAAKAVDVPYTTLHPWCKKQSVKNLHWAPRPATRHESNNSKPRSANFESSDGRPSWSVKS
jgi:hypothetical protein